jgi:inner membrane transporter RhtA
VTAVERDVTDPPAPDRERSGLLRGTLTMTASAASTQVGAAIGTFAYAAVGVPGVVAVRQLVAAAVLLPIARPPFRRFTWAQWWPTLLLAVVLATMNLSLYTAFSRIDLGLAATLEFLGPLAVALVGSRTAIDLVCAVVAGVGVYVLVLPGAATDWLGVGLALLAALCWAAYILLNRVLGRRLPGLQATAAATTLSALGYLPVVVLLALHGRLVGLPLLCCVAVGLLCSAVPYAADLVSLRRIPTRFFGVFMSINPAMAAVVGLVLLHQVLAVHAWTGIGLVVLANAVALVVAGTRGRPPRTA